MHETKIDFYTVWGLVRLLVVVAIVESGSVHALHVPNQAPSFPIYSDYSTTTGPHQKTPAYAEAVATSAVGLGGVRFNVLCICAAQLVQPFV